MSAASALTAAGLLAVVELDAASIGPFLISRPFVVGPLIGWARGDAWSGAVLGAVFEALTLAELPLGGRLDVSAPIAAGTAAWLAASGLPYEAAFAAGIAAGWTHALVERRLRRGRGALARRSEAELGAGREPRLGAKLASALAVQAAATFAVSLAFLAAGSEVLPALWPRLPEFVAVGARTCFLSAPWIGAGGLVAALGRRA